MKKKYVVISESNSLLKNIGKTFNDEIDFYYVDSLKRLKKEFCKKDITLLIADIDIKKIDPTIIINFLNKNGNNRTPLIILTSEQTLLDLKKNIKFSPIKNHKTEWLIKPYTSDTLISTINKLFC